MNKLKLTSWIASAILLFSVTTASGQSGDPETDKLAQTGMKFLSVSLDARASALADAITAETSPSAMAMFYNPAAMAWQESNVSAVVGQTQWIVETDYNYAGASFRPAGGSYGVFGVSLVAVNYGDIIETVRADNESGYLDIGTYSPTALAFGVGYAISLSDRFAVGGNLKFVNEDLGGSAVGLEGGNYVREKTDQNTVAYDFGIQYKTGFRSLNFAMSVRNFGTEVTYSEESFELPLTFKIGVAMDMLDFTDMDQDRHSLLLAVDTERPRDFEENIRLGAEYIFMKNISLRAGYAFPQDEMGVTLGAGLYQALGDIGFNLDYSYTDFGVFDNVNRFTFKFEF